MANVTLIVSEFIRLRNKNKEIAELRTKKETEMTNRSGADSLDTITDEDLEDEIEPKQRHVWILGVVICLNIWIVGAVGTHWWATTFFADELNPTTEAISQNEKTISTVETEVSAANTRGLFGDSFGAVNALVSALAFAGMIVAFVLQRYELRLQRKELRDSRREMKQQTLQFRDQNKNLEIQRFESTFFNMLSQFQEIVSALTYTQDFGDKTKEYKGRELFYEGFKNIQIVVEDSDELPAPSYTSMSAYMKSAGQDSYLKAKLPTYFDHYFRMLYRILKFVDTTPLIREHNIKYEYTSMLRAMLSRYELVWLYYNALSEYGNDKLKPLVERYSMLKHLRKDLLTICKENADYMEKIGIVTGDEYLRQFTGTDYEFFLTAKCDDKTKYNLKAFYTEENMQKGLTLIEYWQQFTKENEKSLVRLRSVSENRRNSREDIVGI